MRILFCGTPEFSAVILKHIASEGEDVVGVFTQPGKPKGRGHETLPSDVEVAAEELGLPCYTPKTLRDNAVLGELEELRPDLIIVVAYGKILPSYVINYPKYGCINIHASLLPRWRGAAPIQRSIISGDSETGVTTMQMDEGLDTGDMLVTEVVKIDDTDDFGTLHDKLAEAGKLAISKTLAELRLGTLKATKQPDEGMTYAAKIEKSEGYLDFSRPARELWLLIRGLSPAPMAATKLGGKLLKIASAGLSDLVTSHEPGEVVDITADGIVVACGQGALVLSEVVPEGKRRMTAAEFARGHAGLVGQVMKWQ